MKGFIKGLLFGSAVGGIGGLLFAPRSGKETQEKIMDEVDDWKYLTEDFNQKLTHFKTSLTDFQVTAETILPPFTEGLNKDIEKFKFQTEPRIKQMQEQLEKIKEELPELPEVKEIKTIDEE